MQRHRQGLPLLQKYKFMNKLPFSEARVINPIFLDKLQFFQKKRAYYLLN